MFQYKSANVDSLHCRKFLQRCLLPILSFLVESRLHVCRTNQGKELSSSLWHFQASSRAKGIERSKQCLITMVSSTSNFISASNWKPYRVLGLQSFSLQCKMSQHEKRETSYRCAGEKKRWIFYDKMHNYQKCLSLLFLLVAIFSGGHYRCALLWI